MDHQSSTGLQHFKNLVGIKFQLYNSLFTSLPFHRIEKTGILLSLLQNNCEEGYRKKQSPVEIIEDFFNKQTTYRQPQERLDLLFRFIQYIERQVVLFDALEDASFKEVNDMGGVGTLKHLESEVLQTNKEEELSAKLKNFAVRLVLTAHPTQFYPGSVLGIINDLSKALMANNAAQINMYLQQLGKTPFFKKQKPTPYDEALNLVWYLENVFYAATGRIMSFLTSQFPNAIDANHPIITMGFWPGGDRDGNPFVTASTTLKVADALRGSIIKSYYLEIRRIKRRLTFEGVDTILADLETEMYNNIFIPGQRTAINKNKILDELHKIREILIYKHNGLFLYLIDNFINKVNVFGLHFASLDVRQESSVHNKVLEAISKKSGYLPDNYASLSDEEKIDFLTYIEVPLKEEKFDDPLVADTIATIKAIKNIQDFNGEAGCNRYIISQCSSALNVLEVYALFLLCGWEKEALSIDIIPLFETVEDLQNAPDVMQQLYSNKVYATHLENRSKRQTIMLGFSDGTKDGGYLMANWGIYKAKENLTTVSKQHEVEVLFFDGRGGPPSRGGGKTHKFYASMGQNISNKEIQLTVQGQTVSSSFGTVESAQFNIEQLLHAGITNELFNNRHVLMNKEEENLLQHLAEVSFTKYTALKSHPRFTDYLSQVSPLKFYSETNIGSRPAKRTGGSKLSLKDLRAIPYVGAWAQLKQNVTGYFGVGSALKELDQQGKFDELKVLYDKSLFFKTLLDNCEMAMKKCFFPLTEFLSADPKYSEIWTVIYDEFNLTRQYILKISGKKELMSDYPVDQLSIAMRERIVLPLLTIQQFAIMNIREIEDNLINSPLKETYEKLIMRSSFGIINAGRNSA
ncbi:MAG: phosphoenolpyruvate carboxylase [Ferruginibacter sp.]|uniref:phosphoenolpyruvate carboxylase n=1 Tax=Ferruginibacter sp. TaxID=1940288 RepID=UPI00265AF415|nr:phosphoenolpyruvate carboxylase [Ferruginibacter sp.]MDB5278088.1 phosphoenolpyruvate carboxylase [Ferruginibacter sp.]